MKSISHIIKNLLKLHDCVIFPGLGGFIAQYAPSTMSNDHLSIKPPYKQILFNKNLTNNDGLLANYIAKELGISYEASIEKISSLLFEINHEIQTNNQFSFEGIGVLYKKNNILNFKQVSENLLLDSFGLKSVNLNDFLNENSESKIIPISSKNSIKQLIKNGSLAASIIVLLFYSAWIPLKTNLFNQSGEFSYSDLNPFTFNKAAKVEETISKKLISKNSSNSINHSLNSLIVLNEKDEKEDETPINFSPNKEIKQNSYEVIIGSFEKEENAENLIKKLGEKSFNARQLPFFNQFFRVSAGKFSNKENAIIFQKKIKKKLRISSWILTK